MTLRAALAPDQAAFVRQSVRVARVAELLDCADSDVRRLIDRGELEAHGIGKRGVRVYLDSVGDYQARRRRRARKPLEVRPKPRTAARSAHVAAEAELRKSGILL